MVASAVAAWLIVAVGACDRNVAGQVAAEGTGQRLDPPAERRSPLVPLAAACGSSEDGSPARTGPLDRPPYLQRVTDTAATIVWTLPDSTTSTVTVTRPEGTVIDERSSTVEPTDRLDSAVQHAVRFEGLSSATTYCYSIAIDGAPVVGRTGFRTAPAPDSSEVVRFVVFGDSGSGSSDQLQLRGQLETVPLQLALITGDVAYGSGTLGQLERHHFDVYDPIFRSIPHFPVAGNHDYRTAGAEPFREVFHLPENGGPEGIERWYSFDWGNVHFVALDTQRTGKEAQADWLEADLQRNDLPWVVAYSHKPAFASGSHGSNEAVQEHLLPILERHGVELLVAGHDHHYERTRSIEGVTHLVTGGGGMGVRSASSSSFTEFAEAVIHFVYATVEGEEMRLHAIDATGREFDGAVVRRNP